MSLIDIGIDRIRVFELPCGIWGNGGFHALAGTVLVKWHSCWNNKLYQVYVNGKYAGTTVDSSQRQIIIPIPTSLESPVRIQVFAVAAGEATHDFSGENSVFKGESGRVKISLIRNQELPIGGVVQIYFDNGTGEIDYEHPLLDEPLRIWPCWKDKAGLGMSRFGLSDFGYDGSAAVGFGKGSFGHGEFGFDADILQWTSKALKAGTYKFGIKVISERGHESTVNETEPITVIPAARPVEHVSVASFDKQTNQLTLALS